MSKTCDMVMRPLAAALIAAALLVGAESAGLAQTTAPAAAPLPAASLALDARNLRGKRTAGGYVLTGQALVRDACQAARFDQFFGNIFPPQFDLHPFRRPGTAGLLCAMHVSWVTLPPKTVVSAAPPHYVSVRTKKGLTRVPILSSPARRERTTG